MTENGGRDGIGAGRGSSRRSWRRNPGGRKQKCGNSAPNPRFRGIPLRGRAQDRLVRLDPRAAVSMRVAAEMRCNAEPVDGAADGRAVESLGARMIACLLLQRTVRRRGAESLATEEPIWGKRMPSEVSNFILYIIDNGESPSQKRNHGVLARAARCVSEAPGNQGGW